MYIGLLILGVLILFFLLNSIHTGAAILFLILSLISIPAVVLHRREQAFATPLGPESQGRRHGVLYLVRYLSIDLAGVTIGVCMVLAVVFVAYVAVRSGVFHG